MKSHGKLSLTSPLERDTLQRPLLMDWQHLQETLLFYRQLFMVPAIDELVYKSDLMS